MRRLLLALVAAYLACGVLLALSGCGTFAPPQLPPAAPGQPDAPPPPPPPGEPTGVAGILTGMTPAEVEAVLGPPSTNPPENAGEADLVGYRVVHEGKPGTWFVGYRNGRVAFVRFAEIGSSR